jgi:hypothetical protein
LKCVPIRFAIGIDYATEVQSRILTRKQKIGINFIKIIPTYMIIFLN